MSDWGVEAFTHALTLGALSPPPLGNRPGPLVQSPNRIGMVETTAMEPAEMKKYLLPGLAVAAVIAVAGLLLGLGGPPPEAKPAKPGKDDHTATGPCIKSGADTSIAGMSDTVPAATLGPEWQVLANGIRFRDVKVGEGDSVGAGQTVGVHYTGWLPHGAVFDSSIAKLKPKQRGVPETKVDAPLEFNLGGVIPGWRDGIPGMKVGGIRQLFIPSAQGYGPNGNPPAVPGNADLVFEVKLLGYS